MWKRLLAPEPVFLNLWQSVSQSKHRQLPIALKSWGYCEKGTFCELETPQVSYMTLSWAAVFQRMDRHLFLPETRPVCLSWKVPRLLKHSPPHQQT